MLSSFRGLKSNLGEKNIHVVDKALDFGSKWRVLSACTKQGLPKDRNTPVKCTRMHFGMTVPSDHTTSSTAWQAVLAAYRDAWKDMLALNRSTESKMYPTLCRGRLTVKSEVLLEFQNFQQGNKCWQMATAICNCILADYWPATALNSEWYVLLSHLTAGSR